MFEKNTTFIHFDSSEMGLVKILDVGKTAVGKMGHITGKAGVGKMVYTLRKHAYIDAICRDFLRLYKL